LGWRNVSIILRSVGPVSIHYGDCEAADLAHVEDENAI
jgi:hypothetical protein